MGLDTTPLPVQELWDCILEFLSKRTPEIRAMALVCRSLCPMAQSQLFHDISTPTAHGGPYDEVAACQRLAEILDHSPHLIPYIRSINLRIELGLHTQVMEMGLINLRCVRLSGYAIFSELDEPGEWTGRLARFLGLPSIRRIEITMRSHSGLLPYAIPLKFRSSSSETGLPELQSSHLGTRPEGLWIGSRTVHAPSISVNWLSSLPNPHGVRIWEASSTLHDDS
ncbi:hypothetical protein DFH09DRAFT_280987 [Mycena vulgaris]|nr:hypothetical protein DFH09DRAFT_280987 [Mycena vulgaris]